MHNIVHKINNGNSYWYLYAGCRSRTITTKTSNIWWDFFLTFLYYYRFLKYHPFTFKILIKFQYSCCRKKVLMYFYNLCIIRFMENNYGFRSNPIIVEYCAVFTIPFLKQKLQFSSTILMFPKFILTVWKFMFNTFKNVYNEPCNTSPAYSGAATASF